MKICYKTPEVKVVTLASRSIMYSVSATNESYGHSTVDEGDVEEEDLDY